jgi:hypothetical protein
MYYQNTRATGKHWKTKAEKILFVYASFFLVVLT